MKKLNMLYTGLVIAATMGSAHAQMRIEISGVGSNQIPVAIAGFANEGVSPQKISAIIKADLERSGAFKLIDAGVINDVNNIDYSGWKAKGADALVVGTVDALADGRYDVRYKLLDTVKQAKISNLDKAVTAQFTRLGPPDRRRRLLQADRHQGRVLDPHRLRQAGGPQLPAAGGRCRRRKRTAGAALERADHLAIVVAGRHQGGLCLVRTEEAGGLRAEPDHPRAHRGGQ
jgi:hypothetical protein